MRVYLFVFDRFFCLIRGDTTGLNVSVHKMKKYLITLILALGIINTGHTEVALSKFESAAITARETNEFMPVWELFLNTEFFVLVIPLDSGEQTSDFKFSIFKSPETQNEPVVLISEEIERLHHNENVKAIKLRGGKLIQVVNSELGIVVALTDGAFGIPKEQVQWLKASTQPAH